MAVPRDGEYTFSVRARDGAKLYLGTTLVVDNDGTHQADELSGPIPLRAGTHALTLLYFQYGGTGTLEVSYEGPGLPKQRIPDTALWRGK